jgi:hypothetical protein
MAKFYGIIGYSSTEEAEETSPGVWKDKFVERPYTGDVIKDMRQWRDSGNVNPDSAVSQTISIVADGFVLENLYSMKYVKWQGATLAIVSATIERPRVIVEIGGLFNGREAEPTPDPGGSP